MTTAERDETELKPAICPYCGEPVKVHEYYGNYNRPDYCIADDDGDELAIPGMARLYFWYCEACDAGSLGEATPEDAIAAWNKRAAS